MPSFRFLVAVLAAALSAAGARAADPVVVELNPTASVGTGLVTVGDVARVSGGDADTRARVSKLDLAELKARDRGVTLGRASVGYRLELAGFDPSAVRVAGADRVAVIPTRRTVTAEEVVAAAREEVLRLAPGSTAELAQPVVVQLPEVPAGERVTFTAKPRAKASGRVQVDMTIMCGGEALLGLAVHLNVKDAPRADAQMIPAGGTAPANTTEVLVKSRQRVEVAINNGGLKLVMAGVAQQDGRLGQSIPVVNPDGRLGPDGRPHTVVARVVGPGKLELELGGPTP